MNRNDMTKDERSAIVYAETCLVDHGGMMEGQRMNQADFDAFDKAQAEGLLTWGRIPACLLGEYIGSRKPTHWVQFNDGAWALAADLRRLRAEQLGPYAKRVLAEVEERRKEAGT